MTSVMTESLLSQSRLGLLNTRSEEIPMQSDGALSESERLGARLSSTQNITNVVVIFQGEFVFNSSALNPPFRACWENWSPFECRSISMRLFTAI